LKIPHISCLPVPWWWVGEAFLMGDCQVIIQKA
jgi:hypothetical protein